MTLFVCLLACIYDKCSAYWVYLIYFEHLKGMVKDEMVQQRWKDHQNSRDFGSVTWLAPLSPSPARTCLETQLPHNSQKWFEAPQKVPSPERCHYLTCQLPEKAPLTRHGYLPWFRTHSTEKPYPQGVFKVIIIISSRSNMLFGDVKGVWENKSPVQSLKGRSSGWQGLPRWR